MITFIIGFTIGVCVGILIFALLYAARGGMPDIEDVPGMGDEP